MHPCDLQIEMTVTSTEVYWLQAEDEREKWRSRKGVGDTWVTAHNGVLISGSFAFVPVFFFFFIVNLQRMKQGGDGARWRGNNKEIFF